MTLLATRPIEQIGLLPRVARAAGVSCRAAQANRLDTSHPGRPWEEPNRTVARRHDVRPGRGAAARGLFDVLMRTDGVLAADKARCVRCLRSTCAITARFRVNGLSVRSQQRMLTAAISSRGPGGMVRAQGLAVLFATVLRTGPPKPIPDLARTTNATRPRARARQRGPASSMVSAASAIAWADRGRRRAVRRPTTRRRSPLKRHRRRAKPPSGIRRRMSRVRRQCRARCEPQSRAALVLVARIREPQEWLEPHPRAASRRNAGPSSSTVTSAAMVAVAVLRSRRGRDRVETRWRAALNAAGRTVTIG